MQMNFHPFELIEVPVQELRQAPLSVIGYESSEATEEKRRNERDYTVPLPSQRFYDDHTDTRTTKESAQEQYNTELTLDTTATTGKHRSLGYL